MFTKYILAFGTEKESILINGTFPQNLEDFNAILKKSILSTVYNSSKKINPFDTADFEISTDGTGLIFTKSVSNILLFNRDGKTPSKSNDKASLIIAKAFSKVAVEDKKLFAINRIKQLPMEIEKITSTKPIEIAGIAGYEIVADDKDKKTGKREKTYQVILFSDSLYYLFFGSAHSDFDTKALLSNKMIRLDQVILLAYKAKNADIALAKASIFNVVGEQKNTYKWSYYFITNPNIVLLRKTAKTFKRK